GQTGSVVSMGGTLIIEVAVNWSRQLPPNLGIVVKTASGAPLFGANNLLMGSSVPPETISTGVIRATCRNLPLMPGTYLLDLYLDDGHDAVDAILDAAVFEVIPADVFGTGKLSLSTGGPFWTAVDFEFVKQEEPELLASARP